MAINDNAIISERRLAALRASDLLDSPEEPEFDRLTKLATAALRAPIALISLVDTGRQFFKSQCGLPEPVATQRQTPLSHSICQHVVTSAEPLLLADARMHPVLCAHPAIRDLGVIAYAGVPILDVDGYVLGSMCVIDTKPHEWSGDDLELLLALSAQVTMELQLRAQTKRLADDLQRHRALEKDRNVMARLNVHDLRTPLSAMLLGMGVVRHLGDLNAEQEEYLALCERNGNSLLSTINNLLDMGSVEQQGEAALRRSACRPCVAIAAAVEQVLPLAKEKSIELTVENDEALQAFSVDVDKFVRVLVNLLGNAVKFTAKNGRVSVRAQRDAGGEFLQFSIQDNGVGMDKRRDVFEEGVRLDEEASTRHSAGLGLTYCKRIVEAHGGRIWFEIEVGVGSVFHVAMPAGKLQESK